jgi:thiamine pyrophosphokinase
MDAHNRIRLLDESSIIRKAEAFGPYFSVFPLDGEIIDFNITGAKYPLQHHTLMPFDSLCVSNEWEEEEVEITFPVGNVILMETRD